MAPKHVEVEQRVEHSLLEFESILVGGQLLEGVGFWECWSKVALG